MRGVAVLSPGYGETADQPLLVRIAERLEREGLIVRRVTFSTTGHRPSRGYSKELDDLRVARDELVREHGGPFVLIGRSFGGRMSAFLAEIEPPDALVVLGHPISPPRRPRPRDEAALGVIACPTLVVQGDRDELGPLAVLERAAAHNPRVDIVTLAGTGHSFGKREPEAIETVARWLGAVLHDSSTPAP